MCCVCLLLVNVYNYIFYKMEEQHTLSGDGNDDGGGLKHYLIGCRHTLTLRTLFAGCLSYPSLRREG